jgi:hypothetical protein
MIESEPHGLVTICADHQISDENEHMTKERRSALPGWSRCLTRAADSLGRHQNKELPEWPMTCVAW